MIIVLKHQIHEIDKSDLRKFLEDHDYRVREIVGSEETVFAAVGKAHLDIRDVEVLAGVARVVPISKPYKLASRETQPTDTVVPVGPVKIGGALSSNTGASSGTSSNTSSGETRIAFQGEIGAYSQMALNRYFSPRFENIVSIPCPEFRDVFEKVLRGECAYAILPLENSLTGSIHENYDLLLQYPDICITGEIRVRIQHSLIGIPGTQLQDIRVVFSHPQGLAQCIRFLDAHPDIEYHPFYDTAGSVAHIAEKNRNDYAAIAHKSTAEVYGMEIITEGIETNPHNYTRFVIIQHRDRADQNSGHIASIVFSTPDKPGALLQCMQKLSSQNLNLTKIESRPIHGKPWEYMFYLDVAIENKLKDFYTALNELKHYSDDIRVLGIYSKG